MYTYFYLFAKTRGQSLARYAIRGALVNALMCASCRTGVWVATMGTLLSAMHILLRLMQKHLRYRALRHRPFCDHSQQVDSLSVYRLRTLSFRTLSSACNRSKISRLRVGALSLLSSTSWLQYGPVSPVCCSPILTFSYCNR